jgi:hypothetical protein
MNIPPEDDGAGLLAHPVASREGKRASIAKCMFVKTNKHEPGKCGENIGNQNTNELFQQEHRCQRLKTHFRNLLLGTTGPKASAAIQPQNENALQIFLHDVDGLKCHDGRLCNQKEKAVEVLFRFGFEVVPATEGELPCNCPWKLDPENVACIFIPPKNHGQILDLGDRHLCKVKCPALAAEKLYSSLKSKTRQKLMPTNDVVSTIETSAKARSSKAKIASPKAPKRLKSHEGMEGVETLTFSNWNFADLVRASYPSGTAGRICDQLTQELKSLSADTGGPQTHEMEVLARYWAEHCPNKMCPRCERILVHRDNLCSFLNAIQLHWHGAVEKTSDEKKSIRDEILSVAAELGICAELFLAVSKNLVITRQRKHFFSTRDEAFMQKQNIRYKATFNREIIDMIWEMNAESHMGEYILELIQPEDVNVSPCEASLIVRVSTCPNLFPLFVLEEIIDIRDKG